MDCQCRCGGIAGGQTLGELEAVRSTRDYMRLRPQLRHSRLVALNAGTLLVPKTFSKTIKQIYIHRGSILGFIYLTKFRLNTRVSFLSLEIYISRAYKREQVTSI